MQERTPREQTAASHSVEGPAYGYPPSVEDEISLHQIAATLGRHKRLIGAIVAACTLVGLYNAVSTQPLYTAAVTARPVSAEPADALSRVRSQLGGVASLAGIDLGGGGGSDAQEFIAILKSRYLGEQFIKEQSLKPHLFPGRWDAEAQAWRADEPGLLGKAARGVSRVLAWASSDEGWRPHASGEPTDRQAYKAFEDVRSVSEDAESGIVTVSFTFRDPERAADWANAYVGMANADIRQDMVREASRALDYLNEKVEGTSVTGLRETLYSLIEAQLERITLANARPEYAFKVLDPAVVPEDRSHPRRALIVVFSLILGGMLGVFAALALESWKGGIAGERAGNGDLLGDG